MVCLRPLQAYRAPGGGVVFNPAKGFRDLPLKLACGQCRWCRLERSRQWAVRCVHENSQHEKSCFVTLTYRPEDLPKDMSLDVRHWQLFAKRLRKGKGPFRFLHCGEYGDENLRPHYHALIFGHDFSEDREPFSKADGHWIYRSEELEKFWKLGFVTLGDVTWQSAQYVARYCLKKVNGEMAEKAYTRVDPESGEVFSVKPEYATRSRGIGAGWYEKFKGDVYPHDQVVLNGKRFRPPKFYDKKLEDDDPKMFERIVARRRKSVDLENATPERLATIDEKMRLDLLRVKRNL